MTIRLTLICHASTPAQQAAVVADDNEPLDAAGRAAAAAAVASEAEAAHLCCCAPERRARDTAAALGLAATVENRLRDCDYGRWRGASLAELQANEPDAVGAWLTDPAAAPHGGESLLALLARVGGWLDSLRTGPRPARRVIAVTHPAVVRAAAVHALAAAPVVFWRIDAGPLTRLRLSGHAGRWNLRALQPPPLRHR